MAAAATPPATPARSAALAAAAEPRRAHIARRARERMAAERATEGLGGRASAIKGLLLLFAGWRAPPQNPRPEENTPGAGRRDDDRRRPNHPPPLGRSDGCLPGRRGLGRRYY